MDGIFIVDKPEGFTSFDVVAKMRGICGTRKIGHGGTLDPMATGVLPVFVGNAAKAVDLQPQQNKCYEATVQLGLATDTGDITGQVLHQAPVLVQESEFQAVLPRFEGEQQQLPPMYSAVKIKGKPLYKYAREGKTVERKPRGITIHSIVYLGSPAPGQFAIRVHCSKGTYIRTLAEDIGTALGLPATLAALRRTQAGVFNLQQAHTLQQLQAAKDNHTLPSLMLPVHTVFTDMPPLQLTPQMLHRLLHGAPVRTSAAPGHYAAWANGVFVGLVQVEAETMRGTKLFYKGDAGENI